MAMSASPEPRRLSLELLPPPADYHSRSPLPSKAAKNEALAAGEDDDRFRTPTTEESRLNSTPTTCPPPPVKIKRGVGCKRKLSELEFFKVEADEIERLFRPRDLQCVRRRRGNICHEERETSSSLSSV
ncbi:hypothetical protein MA16_Dca012343 [Dendrobium catenatum]|uniref:Cyclin-dependent protein kinase inhibitor SMR1 n=2 Tax=Dendrobium catenatum TaxID=906689 RepID=A0A2I0VI21_9ASPA|nr:hypothetical protein MA16_Dca012343 [Dendrobium catenatum]